MKLLAGSIFLATLTMALLFGCSRPPTPVSQFYGTSYELAKQSQVANPQAGIDAGPPTGLEGSIASKIVDRHEKGFEQKAAQTDIYSVIFEGMKQK